MPVPYDHSFKILTDDDPRAALAAFAGIPLDAIIDVEPADRELNLSTLRVDNLYRCRQNGVEFMVHFEAVSRFRNSALDHQTDYVRAIVSKYKLPCRSFMLLLTEEGVPDRFPRYIYCGYGDYRARVRLRPVRLWQLPAASIIQLDRLALYPWIPLMNATPEEIEESARRVLGTGDRKLLELMSVLGGLRYGKKEVFAERLATMTSEEIVQDSYFYQSALAKGEAKGLARGERQMLSRLLTARFGALPAWASEKIAAADIKFLEDWSVELLTAKSLEEVLR